MCCYLFQCFIFHAIQQDGDVADEGDDEGLSQTGMLADEGHDSGGYCAAYDAHDEITAGLLCLLATQSANREGEDGGEHDALKQIDKEESNCAYHAAREQDDERGEGGT